MYDLSNGYWRFKRNAFAYVRNSLKTLQEVRIVAWRDVGMQRNWINWVRHRMKRSQCDYYFTGHVLSSSCFSVLHQDTTGPVSVFVSLSVSLFCWISRCSDSLRCAECLMRRTGQLIAASTWPETVITQCSQNVLFQCSHWRNRRN